MASVARCCAPGATSVDGILTRTGIRLSVVLDVDVLRLVPLRAHGGTRSTRGVLPMAPSSKMPLKVGISVLGEAHDRRVDISLREPSSSAPKNIAPLEARRRLFVGCARPFVEYHFATAVRRLPPASNHGRHDDVSRQSETRAFARLPPTDLAHCWLRRLLLRHFLTSFVGRALRARCSIPCGAVGAPGQATLRRDCGGHTTRPRPILTSRMPNPRPSRQRSLTPAVPGRRSL